MTLGAGMMMSSPVRSTVSVAGIVRVPRYRSRSTPDRGNLSNLASPLLAFAFAKLTTLT